MIKTLLLAGCGKMGSAMLESWLKNNIAKNNIVLDPQPLPAKFSGDMIKHCTNADDIKGFEKKIDVLVLAVKPQIMAEAAQNLREHLQPQTLILSIAAGKTLENYENYFGKNQPIIRTMPNTPAAIGKGAIVAIPNTAGAEYKETAAALLSPSGDLHWVDDENLMNAVTALSGSGPAYVFHLIETLAEAGMKIGLPEDLAGALARQTVIGASALAEQEKDTPASTLRENVTSPGGTTEAALKVLMNGKMQDLFDQALQAAKSRGEELSFLKKP